MVTLVNRAKMSTATTGTGTISLASAESGYQSFAAAGVVDGNTVRYVIEDGTNWEIGTGAYTASGTTLSRTPSESSSAGAAITLTGSAVVYVTAIGSDIVQPSSLAAVATTGAYSDLSGTPTIPAAYTNTDVDAHLNTGTAASGEVLSWTGTDYDWVAVSGGADINGLTDGYAVGGSVGLGSAALLNDDGTNNYNVAVGDSALRSLGNGSGNVAVGFQSLYLTNGTGNIAIGQYAGFSISTGNYNIGIGRSGLRGTGSLSGSNNIGIGQDTGYDLSTGASNFLGGYQAGTNLTTGSDNVAIGNGANDTGTTNVNTIVIGFGSDPSSATVSNEITLGNSSITRFRIPAAGIDNTSAALSGTTPSVDTGARDTYTLSTTGNTTFTFTGAPSSGQVGTFSLIVTAGGTHTLTWPASVDWAGGTAPAAPASGEKDIYTFMTVDGGTTWYGFLAGDAMA